MSFFCKLTKRDVDGAGEDDVIYFQESDVGNKAVKGGPPGA